MGQLTRGLSSLISRDDVSYTNSEVELSYARWNSKSNAAGQQYSKELYGELMLTQQFDAGKQLNNYINRIQDEGDSV